MILLTCEKLSKSFGIDCILDELSFSLKKGSRMGVIGANGTGKTTLFRMITGELSSDSGNIHKTRDISIGYLSQNEAVDSAKSIWDELLTVFDDLRELERKIRALEESIAVCIDTGPYYEKLLHEYTLLTDTFTEMDGYAYESRIRGVLTGLNFSPAEFEQPIWQLSGGQKTRVALAGLLLKKPGLLLMDEPTNHLDLEAVQWLESYLKEYSGTLLIISHDRYFLDHLCDTILEIENHKGRVFEGNYTEYQKKKQALTAAMEKEYTLQQREIERQEAIIRRYKSYNREKSVRAAESRQKALDRMDRLDKPVHSDEVRMSFDVAKQSGHEVLNVSDLTMAFDNNVLFKEVSFALEQGDRLGIIGPNGVGKSTLFRILLGQLQAVSGSMAFGTGVDIGYYDQEQTSLTPANTALDELWNAFPRHTQTVIRNTLALFLFKGDDVYKTVDKLSGGERGRLMLAKLMLSRKNLLLLDEPTNHLDMDSKEVLEDALSDYTGTILAVSHDRYFLNRIVNRILVLEKEGASLYLGNYNDYLEKKNSRSADGGSGDDQQEKTRTALKEERKKERLDRQKKREWAQLMADQESKIAQLEERQGELEEALCDPSLYENPEKMRSIQSEYNKTKAALESAYEDWAALEESLN